MLKLYLLLSLMIRLKVQKARIMNSKWYNPEIVLKNPQVPKKKDSIEQMEIVTIHSYLSLLNKIFDRNKEVISPSRKQKISQHKSRNRITISCVKTQHCEELMEDSQSLRKDRRYSENYDPNSFKILLLNQTGSLDPKKPKFREKLQITQQKSQKNYSIKYNSPTMTIIKRRYVNDGYSGFVPLSKMQKEGDERLTKQIFVNKPNFKTQFQLNFKGGKFKRPQSRIRSSFRDNFLGGLKNPASQIKISSGQFSTKEANKQKPSIQRFQRRFETKCRQRSFYPCEYNLCQH